MKQPKPAKYTDKPATLKEEDDALTEFANFLYSQYEKHKKALNKVKT
jgi:hypothetical protein